MVILIIGLAINLFSIAFALDTNCESDGLHYQCIDSSKKCIPITWLCDGRSDCLNGDDENGRVCEPRGSKARVFERGNCPPRQFECEDLFGRKKCVLEEWRCDRHVDCKGGLDEQDCDYFMHPETQIQSLNTLNSFENRLNCSDSQFLCKTIKECLSSRSMICDGRKDCIDGSDEMDCTDSTSQRPSKLATIKQAIANSLSDAKTKLTSRPSSTQILPIPPSNRPSTNSNNSSTNSNQPSTNSNISSTNRESTKMSSIFSRVQPTSQTNQRVSRGSTEALPISPAKFSAVSAGGNKPQRVKMDRIAGNTMSQSIPTLNTSNQLTPTTQHPVKFVKREQNRPINLAYPQYLIADYPPIIPQL